LSFGGAELWLRTVKRWQARAKIDVVPDFLAVEVDSRVTNAYIAYTIKIVFRVNYDLARYPIELILQSAGVPTGDAGSGK
jgi:hypothetical protein